MNQRWRRQVATLLGWLLALVGATLFVYSLLAIAGKVSSPPGTDLGSLEVAGATLLLASFTLELALSTRAALDQAQSDFVLERQTLNEVQAQTTELKRQATATEAALTSSWRPILVDVARGTAQRRLGPHEIDASSVTSSMDDATGRRDVEISLLNIGSGPAFVESGILEAGPVRAELESSSGLAIPSGSVLHLLFRFDLGKELERRAIEQVVTSHQAMLLMVRYRDLGGHVWRTQAQVSLAEREKRISSVELFDGESLTPFARTG